MRAIPAKEDLTICFAHVAYRMAERFARRETGIRHFQVSTLDELTARLGEFDLLCVSMMWRNEFIARAPRLAFIQSISAGTDQYARDALKAAGIRLASAQGVNSEAVAQHAIALILALTRQLHLARDNQARRHWRGMISDLREREDELAGKTLLIVGLGHIGSRLATLAHAFGIRVIATKCNTSTGAGAATRRGRRPPARTFAGSRRHRLDLPAHAGDRAADQREGVCRDETVGDSGQRCARAGGR